ncbi:SAM-dependent methyltransferase [Defluviimonas sp. 20V17]|uniref:Methyltransferase domain-containing protein n=1 Tax=Allgaiera indica TaxID=765699 RepID=A0AAN4URA9_9RHOB|nr:class I SAM-dependent methyltransferase [Allgaiera indica]KDB03135.1 SAM-dependent methyltransferase [Defluviimonas sp. 20V17]GHE00944.1 SAM-dependent methyltransferase [Allgaiera indica]SDW74937.1 Methyltransferase domain-containing protein [Allgaiera indica]
MNCRHCQTPLSRRFLDLGAAPPSNAYLSAESLHAPELHFPLRLFVCDTCHLVQTEDFASADTFFSAEYAYFSSTSKGWLAHAAAYCTKMTDRAQLTPDSFVIEVASNDGYLLRNFVQAGIPCLGIEPTDSTADAAEAVGVPTLRAFFGRDLGVRLAAEGRKADLIAGNNVYAHVPDINDFTAGLAACLKPEGMITLEFPHLMRLVEFRQFDTVYHEHFSYLSLLVVARIFAAQGLRVFDVEELPTHGGSLRVYGCHRSAAHVETPAVAALLTEERRRGMHAAPYYEGFQAEAEAVKNGLLRFLLDCKAAGRSVAGYGAAAKGNTLLNYAGVRPDLLPFVADAAPAKIGRYLPGSRIPVLAPEALERNRPDVVLILPWNIADEVRQQLAPLTAQGTSFATAVPEMCET